MGTGYTRNDTANNIAADKTASAADIDGEFDAIVAAFNESTGHTHDGTSAEGAPITVIGPAQEYVSDGTSFSPKTDDTYNLGTASLEWKDLYLDGVGYIDSIDTAVTLQDTVDATKKVTFDITNVTTATTRTVTIPDASFTVVGVDTTQTLTNKTINSSGNTLTLNLSEGTLTGTAAEFDTAVSDDTIVFTSEVGSVVQGYDAGLASIAGLTTAADKMIYTTASDTYAVTDLSTFGRSLIDDADASAARTTLGVVIGTDVQAYDADTLKADTHDTLTAGFDSDEESLGTGSGTVTPEVDGANTENFKSLTNNGAFTLAPPSTSSACVIRIHVTNGASAGTITTTGFDRVIDPDTYETTNAKEYFFYIDHNATRDVLTIREIV